MMQYGAGAVQIKTLVKTLMEFWSYQKNYLTLHCF